MDIPFWLRGTPGHVGVTLEVNERPEQVGSVPEAVGFPMCHARVDRPARGYDAVLGWVQLVRSDDNVSRGRGFEVDPLDFIGDVPHPFCWIGLNPQLFDAPWRSKGADLDWEAHSFLCVPESGPDTGLEVHALLGFSWGFRVRNGAVSVVPPAALAAGDWDSHLEVLASRYPTWSFVPGLRA